MLALLSVSGSEFRLTNDLFDFATDGFAWLQVCASMLFLVELSSSFAVDWCRPACRKYMVNKCDGGR